MSSEMHSEEIRKQFAEVVKYQRRNIWGWKQDKLASVSGLGIHTIQDVENAQKKHLDEYTVTRLADAFSLTGSTREGFWMSAGIALTHPLPSPIKLDDFARTFFQNMKYPAMIFDVFWDFQFINTYMLSMFGMAIEQIPREFFHSDFGANHLRMFFDWIMGTKGLYRHDWHHCVTMHMYLFQQKSHSFQHEKRYLEILQALQLFEDFDEIWKAASEISPEDALSRSMASMSLHHPQYGKVNYKPIEYGVPSHLAQRFNAVLYLPDDDETEEAFKQIRRAGNVPKTYRITKGDKRGFMEFV